MTIGEFVDVVYPSLVSEVDLTGLEYVISVLFVGYLTYGSSGSGMNVLGLVVCSVTTMSILWLVA